MAVHGCPSLEGTWTVVLADNDTRLQKRPSSAGYSRFAPCVGKIRPASAGAVRRESAELFARQLGGPWPVVFERKSVIVQQQQPPTDEIVRIPHALGSQLEKCRLDRDWSLAVEICHHCDSHRTVRHDAARYRSMSYVVTSALRQFEGYIQDMVCRSLETPDLSHRMGACEVFLLPPRQGTCSFPAYLVHSKLLTKLWPCAKSLIQRLQNDMPILDKTWKQIVLKDRDASLQCRLEVAEKLVQQQKSELQSKACELQELQATRELELQELREQKDQELQTLRSHKEEAEHKAISMSFQLKQSLDDAQQTSLELARTKDQKQLLERQMTDMERCSLRLEAEVARLQAEQEEGALQRSSLAKALEDASSVARACQDQRKACEGEQVTLRREALAAGLREMELKKELGQMEALKLTYEAELGESQAETQRLHRQLEEAAAKLDEKLVAVEDLRGSRECVTTALQTEVSAIEDYQKELDWLREDRQQMIRRIQSLEINEAEVAAQFAAYREEATYLRKETAEWKASAAAAEDLRKQMAADNLVLIRDLGAAQGAAREAEAQLEAAEQKLKDAKAALTEDKAELQRQLLEQMRKNERQREELARSIAVAAAAKEEPLETPAPAVVPEVAPVASVRVAKLEEPPETTAAPAVVPEVAPVASVRIAKLEEPLETTAAPAVVPEVAPVASVRVTKLEEPPETTAAVVAEAAPAFAPAAELEELAEPASPAAKLEAVAQPASEPAPCPPPLPQVLRPQPPSEPFVELTPLLTRGPGSMDSDLSPSTSEESPMRRDFTIPQISVCSVDEAPLAPLLAAPASPGSRLDVD